MASNTWYNMKPAGKYQDLLRLHRIHINLNYITEYCILPISVLMTIDKIKIQPKILYLNSFRVQLLPEYKGFIEHL